MRVFRCFEKRDWGGKRPTWRAVGPLFRKGSALAYSMRRVTNRSAKLIEGK